MNLENTLTPRAHSGDWIHVTRGPFGRTRAEIEAAARKEGPWPLTDDHWAVIQFVRAHTWDTGTPPAVVRVARATGFRLARLEQLFPNGAIRSALALAGLELPLELQPNCPCAAVKTH